MFVTSQLFIIIDDEKKEEHFPDFLRLKIVQFVERGVKTQNNDIFIIVCLCVFLESEKWSSNGIGDHLERVFGRIAKITLSKLVNK